MRRLIAVTTLGLALSFSSLSFASDHMGLYTETAAKSEVGNRIRGGDVEEDLMSFYTSLKSSDTDTSTVTAEQDSEDNSISAFGVRITK